MTPTNIFAYQEIAGYETACPVALMYRHGQVFKYYKLVQKWVRHVPGLDDITEEVEVAEWRDVEVKP